MISTEFLDQLTKFHLIVSKRVTSQYAGPRKSIAMGKGIIFKDHRIYAPGDDFRAIDWRVYARTDDLYVKNYEEERNLAVHIIVDGSGSMDYGKPRSKFDYASMLGVGFAYLALKDNEKFQFSTFADDISIYQPRRGMGQLAAMVEYLNSRKPKGKSNFLDMLTKYRKVIRSKSMLILVSDFLYSIEEIRSGIRLLGDNEVRVIQVLDPVERNLNLRGDFRLRDSETNDQLVTFVSQRLKANYQEMMDHHTAMIDDICTKLGYRFHSITTDSSLFDAFYAIVG
ncbi:MAG TPA: DUF58 domain-containing protein [Candidatus Nanoarchaeia archaeon]|nr:DUF58 domain-containing protein [Candidatus Nanoarchaeia archaeon]